MTYTMYDDASVAQFAGLTNPDLVFAGYVDGYVTYPWLVANRPHNRLVSITIHGNNATALDIEQGAASMSTIPSWLKRALTQVHPTSAPVLYCAAGNSAEVVATAERAGFKRSQFLLWSAHIGHGEHICGPKACGYPQADGTQWTWTALGRSLDQSILSADWYGASPTPPAPVTVSNLEDPMILPNTKLNSTCPVALPDGTKKLVLAAYGVAKLQVWFHAKNGAHNITVAKNGAVEVAVPAKCHEAFVVRKDDGGALVSVVPSA